MTTVFCPVTVEGVVFPATRINVSHNTPYRRLYCTPYTLCAGSGAQGLTSGQVPGCIDSAQRGKTPVQIFFSQNSCHSIPATMCYPCCSRQQHNSLRLPAQDWRVLRQDGCIFLDCSHFGGFPESVAWYSLIPRGLKTSRGIHTFHGILTFRGISPAELQPRRRGLWLSSKPPYELLHLEDPCLCLCNGEDARHNVVIPLLGPRELAGIQVA
jgi:hypothetical protein